MDEYGSVRKSVALNHKQFNNDNLFISVDQGLESDSDFNVTDLTLGTVSVEWLPVIVICTRDSFCKLFSYVTLLRLRSLCSMYLFGY